MKFKSSPLKREASCWFTGRCVQLGPKFPEATNVWTEFYNKLGKKQWYMMLTIIIMVIVYNVYSIIYIIHVSVAEASAIYVKFEPLNTSSTWTNGCYLTWRQKVKQKKHHSTWSLVGLNIPKKSLGPISNQPLSTLRITNWLVGWFKPHFFSPQQLPTCLAATCSGSHSVDAVEDAEGVGPSMADFFWTGVFLTTYSGATNLCS